jgi:HemX protein
MEDRALLAASTFCFLLGFAHTMFALGGGRYLPSRFNFAAMTGGFAFQTAFLVVRGHALNACPLTNLFEVLIFLSWSMVLLYFVVGTAYRISLLGVFTSPLAFIFQTFALIAPLDSPPGPRARVVAQPWLETHAAISIIAYGAFALACVAGVMYLIQERQLKTHHLRGLFFHLPPIADLAVAINRLILTGFILLTLGLLSGFAVHLEWSKEWSKVIWGVGVWLIYGGILQADKWRRVTPRRIAQLSVAAFSITLATLWGLNFLAPSGSL